MSDPVKVALELQPICGNRTGIGLYTYELAKRLQSDDCMRFQGNLFNFRNRNQNEESLKGVSMDLSVNQRMPYGVYRRIWDIAPLSYSKLFQRSDISHFFNYIVPPRVSGKVVTTIHDMSYRRHPETLNEKNLKRISTGMAATLDRSHKVITISKFSKNELVELLGISSECIEIIPPAPSLSLQDADFQTVCEKYKINAPYILYTGTIEPRKNIPLLIKAYERLKKETGISHKLVLVGGKGWKSEGIYREIEESPVSNEIILTGYVLAEEKNTFYKNASVFVFPSLYEGFGMPLVEAMTHGTPVVATNVASLPEVMGEAGLLVSPSDDVSLAEEMFSIISNPELAEELKQKGFEQVKKFTWEKSAQKLKELYKGMV